MTLIDGDRIITAQLYDDEHEEFTEKKMSVIDYINAYSDEGVTEADVVAQTRWIPVTERLPENDEMVLVSCRTAKGVNTVNRAYYMNGSWHGSGSMSGVKAWQPMP